MKSLVNQVKNMSVKSRALNNSIDFLDHQLSDPMCQRIIKQMSSIDVKSLGIQG